MCQVTNSAWHFLNWLFLILEFWICSFFSLVPVEGRAAPPAGWFPGSCPLTTWSASAPPWRRGWSGPAATRRWPRSAGRWRSAGRPGGGGRKHFVSAGGRSEKNRGEEPGHSRVKLQTRKLKRITGGINLHVRISLRCTQKSRLLFLSIVY